jgi:hypothetical protein
MHEAGPQRVMGVMLGHERATERRGRPRVIRPLGHRFVCHQLGLDADADRGAERLDFVQDRGDRALDERHKARRAHHDALARGRTPLHLPAQDPVAQVKRPLVPHQLAIANVEWLVVDQEPDDLAIGDVDHRLTGLGIAVGRLRIRQWTRLVEAVQERARGRGRLPLVEVAAQTDMAVGEREDRLGLSEQVKVELALGDTPRLYGEYIRADHGF